MNNAKFDLAERTEIFGEKVITFCKSIKPTTVSKPIIEQLVRAATSIGANYAEANNASSKRDLRNKIFIVKKECQETKHWLRMLAAAEPGQKSVLRDLWQESHELTLIFQRIGLSLASDK